MNRREIKWEIIGNGCWRCTSHRAKNKGRPQIGGGKIYKDQRPISMARYMLCRKEGKNPLCPLYVLHKCGNMWCINPDHLYWGTQKDNIRDAMRQGTLKGCNKKDIALKKKIALEDSSLATKQLAQKYNVSPSVIERIRSGKSETLRLLNIPVNKWESKYRREYGFSLQEMGAILGVSRQRIHQLVLKKSLRIKEAFENPRARERADAIPLMM